MYFRAIDEAGAYLPLGADTAGAVANEQAQDGISVHDPVSERPISIRLADTNGHRNAAHLLLNRRYSWRGYGANHVIAASPSHTTFTASAQHEVMGTITLVTDSAKGLAADALYKREIDEIRARPGASVCELTKFAFDAMTSSPAILASLFHLIFIYGHREYGCTDLFIEVTPRHARFYEMMLGFKRLGDVKMNETVSVEGQLLWISVADIRDKINQYAGEDRSKTRSLYRYFFSPKEEDGLYARMTASRSASLTTGAMRRSNAIGRIFASLRTKTGLPALPNAANVALSPHATTVSNLVAAAARAHDDSCASTGLA